MKRFSSLLRAPVGAPLFLFSFFGLAFGVFFISSGARLRSFAQGLVNGQPATFVVGQPNFTSVAPNTPNQQLGLAYPESVALDIINGKLYVSERNNHRVLRYAYPITQNQPAPEMVFGQANFTDNLPNRGGPIAANTLNEPMHIMVQNGNLWVCDATNNRVLRFSNAHAAMGDVNADLVLGQVDFSSGTAATTQSGMNRPCGIAWHPVSNKLYIAETFNHRVLRFDISLPANGMPAEVVLGQPNFISSGFGLSATQMTQPAGLAVDAGGALYVADAVNNRVLRFNSAHTLSSYAPANAVYGQPSFVMSSAATTQQGLSVPIGLAIDISTNDLYVAEEGNRRVVVYFNAPTKPAHPTADRVLGEQVFTTSNSLTTRVYMSVPRAVVINPATKNILIADAASNRVLVFDHDLPLLGGVFPPQNMPSVPSLPTVSPSFNQLMSALSPINFHFFGGMTGVRAGSFSGGGTPAPSFTPNRPLYPGERVQFTLTTGATLGDGVVGAPPPAKPFLNGFTPNPRATPFVGEFIARAAPPVGGLNFVQSTVAAVGGPNVAAIAAADFDGDGKIDVAAASFGGQRLAVRRNYGMGNFAQSGVGQTLDLAPGFNVNSVQAADINNDGRPDWIITEGGNIRIFPNTSAPGMLSAGGHIIIAVGGSAQNTAIADFDGDGRLDIAIISAGPPNELRIYRNNYPMFTLIQTLNIGGVAPNSIVAGDFNNDGAIDITIGFAAPANNIRTYHNNGGGQMQETSVNLACGAGVASISVGAIDANSSADIVCITTGNEIRRFLNDGFGNFSAPQIYIVPGSGTFGDVVLGDIDGVNGLDIVWANPTVPSTAAVGWFTNDGSGMFGLSPSGSVKLDVTQSRAIALGDIDNDGDLDMIVGHNSVNYPFLSVIRNEYPPTVNTAALLPPPNAVNVLPNGANINIAFTNNPPAIGMTTGTASLPMNPEGGPIRIFGGMTGGRNRLGGGGTWSGVGANSSVFMPAVLPAPAAPNQFFPGETVSVTIPARGVTSVTSSLFSQYPVKNARFVPMTQATMTISTGHVRQFVTRAGLGPGTFFPTRQYLQGVANQPRQSLLIDVNNDGWLDLVTANSGNANFYVQTGAGAGTFNPPAVVPLGANADRVAAGDFDNDGDMDLVFTLVGSDNIRVVLNNPTGTFTGGVNLLTGSGTNPRFPRVVDVNGDGNLDIVLANTNGTGNQIITIFWGRGDGSFSDVPISGRLNIIDASISPEMIVAGDINNDGDIDLALSANILGPGIHVFSNSGNGDFSSGNKQVVHSGTPIRSVALADIDNDGDLDLLAVSSTSALVCVYLNGPLGQFAPTPTYSFPLPGAGLRDIQAADVNGDGFMDIVVSNDDPSGYIAVLINNGGSGFAPPQFANASLSGAHYVAIGDVDGDGDLDIVVPNAAGANSKVVVLLNANQPRFICTANCGPPSYTPLISPQRNINSAPPSVGLAWRFTEPMTTATAQFPNVAGGPIRIFGGMTGGRSTTLATGGAWNYNAATTTATFTPSTPFLPGEEIMVSVTSAQSSAGVNARPYTYQYRTQAGVGPATFFEVQRVDVGVNLAGSFSARLDNNASVDIAVAQTVDDRVQLLFNNGAGNFTLGATVDLAPGANPQSITGGDFDNDGDIDLAVSNNNGTISILHNNGMGVFTLTASPSAGLNPRQLCVADFDNDGDLDIAVANVSSNFVTILFNNGTGVFTPLNVSVVSGIFHVAAADVDSDGDMDIVTATSGGLGAVRVLRNNGFGGFAAETPVMAGSSITGLVVGNFDTDADMEIAISNGSDTKVIILDNTGGAGNFTVQSMVDIGVVQFSLLTGDFNGDGALDLAAIHFTPENRFSVMLNNGSGVFSLFHTQPTGNAPTSLSGADYDGDGDIDIAVTNFIGVGGQSVSIFFNQPPLVGTCFGNALRIEPALNQRVQAPVAPGLNAGSTVVDPNFTVEALFRVHSVGVPQTIVAKWNGAPATSSWILGLDAAGRLSVAGYDDVLMLHNTLQDPNPIPVGAWQHVAFVFNRTFGIVSLYRNGRLVDIKPIPFAGLLQNAATPITMGAEHSGANGLNGDIDEVRFWSAPLPQELISVWRGIELRPSHPLWSQLQGYWRFNQRAGAFVEDFSSSSPPHTAAFLTAGMNSPRWIANNQSCSIVSDVYRNTSATLPAWTEYAGGTSSLTYSLVGANGGATLGNVLLGGAPSSNATYSAFQVPAENQTDLFSYTAALTAVAPPVVSTGTVRVFFRPFAQGGTAYAQSEIPSSLAGSYQIFGGTAPFTYFWQGLSGPSFNVSNPAAPVITTEANIALQLTVRDAFGFMSSTTVNVVVLGGNAFAFSAMARGTTNGFNGGNTVVVSRAPTPFTVGVFQTPTGLLSTTASLRWSIAPAPGGVGAFAVQGVSTASLIAASTLSTNATFVWKNAPPQGGSTQAVITVSTTAGLFIASTQILVTVVADPAHALALAMSQSSSSGTHGVNAGAFNQGLLNIVSGKPFNVAFGAWNGWNELSPTNATVTATITGAGGESAGFIVTSASVILNNASTGVLQNLAVAWEPPLSLSTTVTLRLFVSAGSFLQATTVSLTLSTTPLEPIITSFSPTTGATSSVVTLTGLNLGNVTAVAVGGVPAQAFTINSPTQLSLVVSTGATGFITATNIAGTGQSGAPFTFVSPPSGLMLSSTQAAVGQVVVVSGNNLVGVQTVFLGGLPVPHTVTNGQISFVIPSGATSGPVTVQTVGGSAVSPTLTVIPAPEIFGVSSVVIATGGTIVITGANLTSVTSLTIGSVPLASFMIISSTEIVAVVGSSSAAGLLTAYSPAGVAYSPSIVSVVGAPTIDGVSTTTPVAGSQITVNGSGFVAGMTVTLGGVPLQITQLISPNEFTLVLPPQTTSGTLVVSTPFGSASFAQELTLSPAPIVPGNIDFTPAAAGQNATVTITGQGFVNIVGVFFGGVPATSFTVESPTRILAVVSTGATGRVRVQSTNASAESEREFLYLTPLAQDSIAALGFYNATIGQMWKVNTHWQSSTPLALWHGVSVENGRIVSISLPYNNLSGSLTSAIVHLGAMTALKTLNLSGNPIGGTLASSIVSLSSLTTLNLSAMNLSGIIPPELATLPSLEVLRLDSNRLEGSATEAFCSARYAGTLREMRLNNNRLTGFIPPCIVEFRRLQILYLQANAFTGGLPERITDLQELREFVASDNNLSGDLPRSFAVAVAGKPFGASVQAFPALERFDIARNLFSGALPSGIGAWGSLRELLLNDNMFAGALPAELGALLRLERLDVSRNALSGSLPASFGSLRALREFSASRNTLAGALPVSVENWTQIERLNLDSNAFEGAVPSGLEFWRNARVIGLSANRFVSAPTFTLSLSRLAELRLDRNKLTFESLEGNAVLPNAVYAPQDSVGEAQERRFRTGAPIDLEMSVGGSANRYRWYKNGAPLGADSSPSGAWRVSASASEADNGVYECRITNNLAPKLTLYSRPIRVVVDSAAPLPSAADGLQRPVPLFPPNNGRFLPLSFALRWTASEGATRYDVQVSSNGAFTSLVKSVSVTATTASVEGLNFSTRYWWRVRAVGANNQQTLWSEAFFTTANSERPLQMTSLDFGRAPLGDTVIREALIMNLSSVPQLLNSVQMQNDDASDQAAHFTIRGTLRDVVVGAGELLPVQIAFVPRRVGALSATAVLAYRQALQDGASRLDTTRNIVQGFGGAFKLRDVDFDAVRAGGSTLRTTELTNVSNAPIRLEIPRVVEETQNGVFSVVNQFGEREIALQPFETAQILLRCQTPDSSVGRKFGSLVVGSDNDTARAQLRAVARLLRPNDIVARFGIAPRKAEYPPGSVIELDVTLRPDNALNPSPARIGDIFRSVGTNFQLSFRAHRQTAVLYPDEKNLAVLSERGDYTSYRVVNARWERLGFGADSLSLLNEPLRLLAVAGSVDSTDLFIENATLSLPPTQSANAVFVEEPLHGALKIRFSRAGGLRRIGAVVSGAEPRIRLLGTESDLVGVEYSLPQSGEMALELFDALGRKIRSLTAGRREMGAYFHELPTAELPSGGYVIVLRSAGGVATQRLNVIR
jgi:Leucine-rich repeat (LRR) protein